MAGTNSRSLPMPTTSVQDSCSCFLATMAKAIEMRTEYGLCLRVARTEASR